MERETPWCLLKRCLYRCILHERSSAVALAEVASGFS